MSDVDPSGTVTTATDGVTVEKSFEPDDFPVPAIAFDLRSTRDTAASVRLVDTVPDDVGPENIGFHPKYGAEFWDVDGDRIVFEREIAPEESYTTVYGLRGGDVDVAATFLSEPRLEAASPDVGSIDGASAPSIGIEPTGDRVGSADSAEIDRSAPDSDGSPDSDAFSGLGLESVEHNDVDPRRDASTDPTPAADSVSEGGPAPDAPDRTAGADGGLLKTLADELEAASPDDPDVVALRRALGVEASTSVETRIGHLQSTVADLEAYTDALEGFLDENGDAQSVVADLRERHDETVGRVDEVETTAEGAADALEAVRADVEALETEVESLSSELEAVLEMRDRLANAFGGASSDGSTTRGGRTAVGADTGRTGIDPAVADSSTDTDPDCTTTSEADPDELSDRE